MINLYDIGLSLFEDFISEETEAELLQNIKKASRFDTDTRNTIQRFGCNKAYPDNVVSDAIPECFEKVVDTLIDQNILTQRSNSITINEYLEGQRILAHIDNQKSGDTIVILSLLGDATMVFEKDVRDQIPIHKVFIPRRSLIKMVGEVRWRWKHSIEPVVSTRYSVVFRRS